MRPVDADRMRLEWLRNGENEYIYDTNDFLNSIDEQPTVDSVPVVHAHWEWNHNHCHWKCTNCGGEEPTCKSPYCKWCGAMMDEVEHEKTD